MNVNMKQKNIVEKDLSYELGGIFFEIQREEILNFLAKNDINIFMYGGVNEGISSVIDYAL